MSNEREAEIRHRYPATEPPKEDKEAHHNWLESQRLLYEAAIDHIHDAVVVTDYRGRVTKMNESAVRLFGRNLSDLENRNILDCFRDENGDSSSWMGRRILRLESMIDQRWVIVRPDGSEVPVLLTLKPIVVEGVLVRVIGTMRDQSEIEKRNRELEVANHKLAEANRRLEELARTDEMTGLLNRRAFRRRLEEYTALSRRHDQWLSILYIDPNKFKPVNDTYGHKQGDRVIQQVASRFRRTLYDTDIVARYGGDEFVAILPQTNGEQLAHVLEKLRRELRFSVDLHHPKRGSTCSTLITVAIGAASRRGSLIPDTDVFVELAEQAMYRSKRNESPFETDIED